MGSNNFNALTLKTTSFQLDKNIINCDGNSNYIAVINNQDEIDIYSSETYKKLFHNNIHRRMIHIQFHPKYYDVFSVTFNTSSINIYYINSKNNSLEVKVEYISSKDIILLKTLFSSYKNGKTLATLTPSYINIWRIDKYYNIYNINIDITDINYYQFKWSQSGEFLIYCKDLSKIEIFSLKTKSIIYHFDYILDNHYYLLESSKKTIKLDNKFLSIMEPKNNNTQNLISFKSNSLKQSDYDDNNSLLYLFYDQTYIFIYNLQLKKLIFEHKVRQCQKFRLLKGKYTNPKLFTKLIFFSQDKKLEIFEIFSKNNIQRNSEEIEANDNFLEKLNCKNQR